MDKTEITEQDLDNTEVDEQGPDANDDEVLLIAPKPAPRIPRQRTGTPRRAATRREFVGGVIVREGNWVDQTPAKRKVMAEGTGSRRRTNDKPWYQRWPIMGLVGLMGTAAVIVATHPGGHVSDRQVGPAGPNTELVAASATQPAAPSGPCWASAPAFINASCTFGDAGARVSVALAGDSSSAQWLDTMKALAAQRNWRITTYLASNCAMSTAAQPQATAAATTGCAQWVTRTTDSIKHGNFNLVLLTNAAHNGDPTADPGYAAMLKRLRDAGLTVIPAPATNG
jgi:hypothetical protein